MNYKRTYWPYRRRDVMDCREVENATKLSISQVWSLVDDLEFPPQRFGENEAGGCPIWIRADVLAWKKDSKRY